MDKTEILNNVFNTLRFKGIVKNQKEFAKLLNADQGQVSRALRGEERCLSDKLIENAQQLIEQEELELMFPSLSKTAQPIKEETKTILVIPTSARGGTLGDFAESVQAYDCERIISPIKDADFAMMVTGDSMSPDFPSGSQILIKRIYPDLFLPYGNTMVLDTMNGAVIKNVFPTDNEDVIECRSINPVYPPFQVKKSDINGWYRVLMVMSLK